MLNTSASIVLAALRDSTYYREYALPLRVLRPCGVTILSILLAGMIGRG